MNYYIPLTRGFKALVSEKDYRHLLGMTWHAHTSQQGFTYAKNGDGVAMHVYLMRPPKGMLVDHINGDKLDNRRENLRIATDAENSRNVVKREGHTSSYKGVAWDAARKKWKAQIKTPDGKQRTLGRFSSEEEAAKKYDEAASLYFGEFAFLNFPPPAPEKGGREGGKTT